MKMSVILMCKKERPQEKIRKKWESKRTEALGAVVPVDSLYFLGLGTIY